MKARDLLADGHRKRSDFIRELVHRACIPNGTVPASPNNPPRKIVQFWDDLNRLPADVGECIATWQKTEGQGFERILFDKHKAREFIQQRLGQRHKEAYDRCYHPAMQSDYFRLSYIFVEGGYYIDADDVYHGAPIQNTCNDGRLKIQPLCYDIANQTMVPPSLFSKSGAYSDDWIFYFDTTPLIAPSGHPLIYRALVQATRSLEKDMTTSLPEIQSTAGPGNLTQAIFEAAMEGEAVERSIVVLHDWQQIATSKWPLSYRNDARNWRLSNCRAYQEPPVANV